MKYKIQNDKELLFQTDDKWKNEQFLESLTQNQTTENKPDPILVAKLDKFLIAISSWLNQAAFVRSNLNTDEISLVSQSINTDSFFNGFYDIDCLSLSYLTFNLVKDDLFTKFKHLKALDLTETKLEIIPSCLFQSLIYLIKLKIGKNAKKVKDAQEQIGIELPPFLFEYLVSLTHLDLLSIQSINYKTFTGLAKLESLNIDTITQIDPDMPFRYLRNLRFLTIKDTFMTLNDKLFNSLSCLLSLTLSFNPLAILTQKL